MKLRELSTLFCYQFFITLCYSNSIILVSYQSICCVAFSTWLLWHMCCCRWGKWYWETVGVVVCVIVIVMSWFPRIDNKNFKKDFRLTCLNKSHSVLFEHTPTLARTQCIYYKFKDAVPMFEYNCCTIPLFSFV